MTNENDNAITERSEVLNLSHPATGADEEGKMTRALDTLRLLNDKKNPLSLSQALARARALAAVYIRWEESGTLIKDIVVCLSDGQEIAMDQSKVPSLCGLRIRNTFESNTVLHIWKQADEKFGKVQLLSLSLRNVDTNGYSYEKTYKNGQTLSLKVEMCADGQLYISVDFTAKERTMTAAAPKSYNWLPFIIPAAASFSIWHLFRHRSRAQLGRFLLWQHGAAFTAGLTLATVSCIGYFLLVRPSAGTTSALSQAPLVLEDQRKAERDPPPVSQAEALQIQSKDTSAAYEMSEKDAKSQFQWHHNNIAAPSSNTAVSNLDDVTVRAAETNTYVKVGWQQKKKGVEGEKNESDTINKEQMPIYVTARSKGNVISDGRLFNSVVRALERTNNFSFLDSPNIIQLRQKERVIDIRFAPKKDSLGIILGEMYDDRGNLLWQGHKDCDSTSLGKEVEDATQALITEMLSTMNASQTRDGKTE